MTPFDSPVTIKLSRLIDLLFRSSLRLPREEVLVDNEYKDSITKCDNWNLMVNFEPIDQSFHDQLLMLGFQSIQPLTDRILCWRMIRHDVWLKNYQYQQEQKQIQITNRQKMLEFNQIAKAKLQQAKSTLMKPPWSLGYDQTISHLNFILNTSLPEVEVQLRILGLLDLKGKIPDVITYLN